MLLCGPCRAYQLNRCFGIESESREWGCCSSHSSNNAIYKPFELLKATRCKIKAGRLIGATTPRRPSQRPHEYLQKTISAHATPKTA